MEGQAVPSSKHALLIGINEYPYFPAGMALRGAVNDVESLRLLLLQQFCFAEENIEALVDGQATRDGILAALGRLLERTRQDDAVLLHFSGHGSQRAAPRSDHRGDRLEKVIVPYDSAHSGAYPNRDISGAELYTWLRHLSVKTRWVTWIFDACHAGTLDRERKPGSEPVRTVEMDERPASSLYFPWRLGGRGLPGPGESGWLPASASRTLIAACRGSEEAAEVTIRVGGTVLHHGALTYALRQAFAAVDDDATYGDLRPLLMQEVQQRFPDQHPQIEGADDRLLFKQEASESPRQILVSARRGRRLVLDAGAVHGVTAGSTWAIHPPAPNASRNLGRAHISLVQGISSDAVVIPGTDCEEIRVGCRALEESSAGLPSPFRVATDIPEDYRSWGAALVRAIDRTPALQHVGSAAEANVLAAVLGPRSRPARADRGRSLGPVESPLCALLDSRDNVLARWHRLHDPLALNDTLTNLEKLCRRHHFLSLTNPQRSPLDGKVGLKLMRRDRRYCWVEAQREAGGVFRFEHQEPFALELTNRHTEPVYAFVIDLGLGGQIEPIYPMPGACEPLAPGETVRMGFRQGQELFFQIPPEVPFDDPGARPWSGSESLKLLATADPTDIRPIFQEAFRAAGWQSAAASSPLAGRLGYIFSDARRDVRVGHSPSTVAWTCETVELELSRPLLPFNLSHGQDLRSRQCP